MTTFYLTPTKPRLSRRTIEECIKRYKDMLLREKWTPEERAYTENWIRDMEQQLYSLEPTKKELKQAR